MKPAAAAPARGFAGVMHAASLTDVIQMECLALSSRAVRVENGAQTGRIYFAGGQVVHAEVGTLIGEDAFFEILHWHGGAFHIEEGRRAPDETITRNWESMLMEAAHRTDEMTEATVTAFPLNTQPMDPIAQALEDPEISSAVSFGADGEMRHNKGADPETLQGTTAFILQLLEHIGGAIGAETLHEVHLIGTTQRAVCVVNDELVISAVASAKTNLTTLAKKLQ